MLSKKTYIAVAAALGKYQADNGLVGWFSDYFSQDNPLFDTVKFQEAVANARPE